MDGEESACGSERSPGGGEPVAVVGAGPVGLLVANLLAGWGVPVVVYERDSAPGDLPRAVHLDDDALRTLQAAGLAMAVAAAARPSAGMELVGADRRVFWRFARPHGQTGQTASGHPPSSLVHQPHLEAVLRAGLTRFPHVRLRTGETVTEVLVSDELQGARAGPRGARVVSVRDGRRRVQQARFVLGCDGAASSVRRLARMGTVDARFDQRWLVLDAREAPPGGLAPADRAPPSASGAGPAADLWAQQLCDPSRPSTYVPVGGPDGCRCRWEFLLHSGDDVGELTSPAGLAALTAPWRRTGEPVRVERLAVYRFHALQARRWRRGPVLLLGDAAHQMPPFLGQGLCAGIRDAANLAWKLHLVHADLAGEVLLDTYEAERAPQVRAVTGLSVLLGRVVSGGDVPGRALRGALRLAGRAPGPLRARLQRPAMPGLPRGPLVPRPGGLRRLTRPRLGSDPIGRSFPQPPVRWEGQQRALDDLLGTGFAVVALERACGPGGALLDPGSADWFAALGRVVLVGAGTQRAPAAGARRPRIVEDVTGELEGWFARRRATAAIVRPDRYVYALAVGAADLRTSLGRLRATLTSGRATPRRL